MNLLQASRKLLDRAQVFILASLLSGLLILSLTIKTFFQTSEREDIVLLLLISILQIAQTVFKYRALYWGSQGDEPRRMEQFRSGLGIAPSTIACVSIERLVGICDEPLNSTYWLSQKPAGARRMVEMILESSFYTEDLANRCAKFFRLFAVVGTILSLISLIAGYFSFVHLTGKPAQIVIAALVFFLTSDFLTMGLQYRDLSIAAHSAHQAAYSLLSESNVSESNALELAMTYNVASSQSPPLISYFHYRNRDDLDKLFKRHYSSLLGI